ncbi:MAG: 1-(5-phosphoribosyl)-5-((5-phosphoribosylamino)methylideneamino)imidazole-4-carboxamide isomerase, partial [Planctomycetes bacterium]|nr:1-(5-phosphoribosyl)-5-((5-phosphoribosylamino)methylideneamino)imidazole-4-carboxamide isomerase [Planctomycetota bacterium]
MDVLPAIDLREGRCVRLLQGDYDRQIDYVEDPVGQARDFETAGARWLHVVDLDGAKHGKHYNLNTLKSIRQNTSLNIEVGGGIRTEESVKTLLDIGLHRVLIGTQALEEPE